MSQASPSHKLLREHSRWRLAWKVGGIALFGLVAFMVRLWIVEGIRIPDRSLHPRIPQGSWIWACKTGTCVASVETNSVVLLETHIGQRLVRVVAAGPGALLNGEANGRISSPGFQHRLRGNPWFLEKTHIRVPRKGDFLEFSKLNGAELDLALRLYRSQNPKHKLTMRGSLWIDGREVPVAKASIAQLYGIPVKPSEIASLSWQEIDLVEMQILRQEHGSSKVEIRREVLRKDSLLTGFKVWEDCFFTTCLSGSDCVDSRELGYIPRNQILGKIINAR